MATEDRARANTFHLLHHIFIFVGCLFHLFHVNFCLLEFVRQNFMYSYIFALIAIFARSLNELSKTLKNKLEQAKYSYIELMCQSVNKNDPIICMYAT